MPNFQRAFEALTLASIHGHVLSSVLFVLLPLHIQDLLLHGNRGAKAFLWKIMRTSAASAAKQNTDLNNRDRNKQNNCLQSRQEDVSPASREKPQLKGFSADVHRAGCTEGCWVLRACLPCKPKKMPNLHLQWQTLQDATLHRRHRGNCMHTSISDFRHVENSTRTPSKARMRELGPLPSICQCPFTWQRLLSHSLCCSGRCDQMSVHFLSSPQLMRLSGIV